MKYLFSLVLVAFAFSSCGDDAKTSDIEALPLNNKKQELSYLMGADVAKQLVQDPNLSKYDLKEIISGFDAALKNPQLFDQGCQAKLQEFVGPNPQAGEFNMSVAKEASNCIGKYFGQNFIVGWKSANALQEFDLKYVKYGFELALNKQDTLIKAEVAQTMVADFMNSVNSRISIDVEKKEKAFFAKVKSMPNTVEIEQSIYLQTLKAGNGGSPLNSDDVKAHYVLFNVNGDTLQSSLGQPDVPIFNLGGVIPGWTIGIPKMKKGGKYKLYVPQALAYGKNTPDPATIPPFSTLVFYVELIDFGKPGTIK